MERHTDRRKTIPVLFSISGGQVINRDIIGTGNGTVPGGTTSLWSSLGTFFVLALDYAKHFRLTFSI